MTDEQMELVRKYDLTRKHTEYLDVHLVFPILDFMESQKVYDEKDLISAKLELLETTNMLDFKADEYKKLHGDLPSNMDQEKEEILARLGDFSTKVQPILDVQATQTENEEASPEITFEDLQKNNITAGQIETLYDFAKFLVSIAKYSEAHDYLLHYTSYIQYYNQQGQSNQRNLDAVWGQFMANILLHQWQPAMEGMQQLRAMIDDSSYFYGQPLMQYQQRAWLLHWSLFVFFNYSDGLEAVIDDLVDLFFNEKYLNVIQTICPHMLRYLATAMIVGKRTFQRSIKYQKILIRVISQEQYDYKDPVTQFIYHLFVKYDFTNAAVELTKCEQIISHDFFLVKSLEPFLENARLYMIELYCRLHTSLNVSELATTLSMDEDMANTFVDELITKNELHGQIEDGIIKLNMHQDSVNDRILDQTNQLTFRSNKLRDLLDERSTAA